jgi:fructan beta-fructosidase
MAETSGEKYRPQFHFTAPKGWLNDPNGLVYENGEWHLFYQHNPNGTNWVSELFWGHAVSKDLLHWNHLPEALPPMPTPAGKVAGSWSGTGFIDFNNSAGFKTGDEPPIMLVWTAVGVGQCLAYSNDHGRTFIRYEKNPVVAMDPPKSGDWDRDPRVFWHEPTQKWVMVFSISGKGMIFYTSRDLKTWEKQTLFTGLFECPDIFELPVDGKAGDKKWIIWDAAGKYFIGLFDGREFHPESGPFILDHGSSYYAAQTWSNAPAGRRVGIGWMREGRFPGMPFNQQMGIPFELSLRNTPDGARLTKTPIKEVEPLRYDTKEWKDLDLDRSHNPLSQIDGKSDTLDIEAEIETRNASEVVLKVRGNTLRLTPDLLWLNNSAAPLRPIAGKIKLRILVDRTSVEIFANDGLVSLSASYLPSDDEKKRDKPPELYAEQGIAKINWMRVHRLKSAL